MTISVGNLNILIHLPKNVYLDKQLHHYQKEATPDVIIDVCFVDDITDATGTFLYEVDQQKIYQHINNTYEIIGYDHHDKTSAITYQDKTYRLEVKERYVFRDELIYHETLRIIAKHLLDVHTLIMHASAIMHHDHALLFVGSSGIGKSSVAEAFLNQYPKDQWINDDKPLITYNHQEFHVSSSPWAGKDLREQNNQAPCYAMVFIERDEADDCRVLSHHETIARLFPHIQRFAGQKENEHMLNLINELILNVKSVCYRMKHNHINISVIEDCLYKV